jgi:hypothetical protein
LPRSSGEFGNYPDREFWAVDCETDPFKAGRIPRPFIWGAYNGSEYHEFATVSELLEFLTARDCVAYAHNGGKFDWHYVLEFVPPFTTCMIIGGRLAKFKIDACEFRDSFNIMPMPLRAGGQKFEIEDFAIFELEARDLPSNRALIKERVRTDCVYLWHLLDTFFIEFGQHLTIGTASMNAWAKIADVRKPETTQEFYARVAPYYFGGRVESFTSGCISEPFVIVDQNSAYPYAMTFKHPYGVVPNETRTLPAHRGAIERSFITLACVSLGAFPFRDDAGSLRFPDDGQIRQFHVTGWEYLAALDCGLLRDERIETVLSLPETIEFNSYLDHFYKMKTAAKASGDKPRYEFAKRFLNSLYGKFGSNPENYSEYKLVPPRFIEAACEAEGYQVCAELGPHALLSRPLIEEKMRYYNVATAASVTGFVRAYDMRSMHTIRQSGERVHYIDTDALFVTGTGDLELDDDKLGAWKVEARCVPCEAAGVMQGVSGAFAGKKMYAAHADDGHWKSASKGVRLTPEEIVRVARGEEIEHIPEVPQFSMKGGIRFINRAVRRTS